jgi:hypothetical protein
MRLLAQPAFFARCSRSAFFYTLLAQRLVFTLLARRMLPAQRFVRCSRSGFPAVGGTFAKRWTDGSERLSCARAPKKNGGEGRIRTFVGKLPADLQSAPFGHSGTSPPRPSLSSSNAYAWSRWPDSNWQPTDYKSGALPVELHRRRSTPSDRVRYAFSRSLDPPWLPSRASELPFPAARRRQPAAALLVRMAQVPKSKLGLLSTGW